MTQEMTEGKTGTLAEVSAELASAVERAGASVVRVEARRGNAASGIVWSAGGQILAADHTLERDEDITVGFGDGRSLPAAVVARDPGTDLALLQVEASDLSPAIHAEDGSAKIGHLVLAIGRPGPTGLMASFGIVSALGGPWRAARGAQVDGFVRTDAMLYPGFSGGPLVNTSGEVVALNSWTLSQGAGLALPISIVVSVASALARGGVKRPYLGIGTQTVRLPASVRGRLASRQESGLMLLTVEQGGPAEKSGLMIGDILLEVDGNLLHDTDDLLAQLAGRKAGAQLATRVVRGGEAREISVVLGERP